MEFEEIVNEYLNNCARCYNKGGYFRLSKSGGEFRDSLSLRFRGNGFGAQEVRDIGRICYEEIILNTPELKKVHNCWLMINEVDLRQRIAKRINESISPGRAHQSGL
jgi:hypothetical protein